MTEDDITITADGAKVHASEKVSTGQYENHQVSQTLDLTIEGVDVTDGVPEDLQAQLRAVRRAMQNAVIEAAEDRKEMGDDPDADRVHEVS